ncbi:unnamed protein product [Choristocarpus tenellus]
MRVTPTFRLVYVFFVALALITLAAGEEDARKRKSPLRHLVKPFKWVAKKTSACAKGVGKAVKNIAPPKKKAIDTIEAGTEETGIDQEVVGEIVVDVPSETIEVVEGAVGSVEEVVEVEEAVGSVVEEAVDSVVEGATDSVVESIEDTIAGVVDIEEVAVDAAVEALDDAKEDTEVLVENMAEVIEDLKGSSDEVDKEL